nr:MAG TPA: Protein of unknown function (DUF3277) [Caudoviricetes sp.]
MANKNVLTYDPKKVLVILGGTQITGFSDDDIITVKPLGDGMTIYVGADGEVGRSVDPNQCFEVTVTLATTSKSNDYLSSLYNQDRANGNAMKPLMIKDLSGSTLFFADQAWPQNFPEAGRGRQIDGVEWTLNTGTVTNPIIGGNN